MTPFEIVVIVWLGVLTLAVIVVALNRGPSDEFIKEEVKSCAYRAALDERRLHEEKWHPESQPKPPFPVPYDVNVFPKKDQPDIIKALLEVHLEKPNEKPKRKKK